MEQKQQNSEALTEKERPWCFEQEARFPRLLPGRTGDILAKIREDCSTLWQQGSRGAQRLLQQDRKHARSAVVAELREIGDV